MCPNMVVCLQEGSNLKHLLPAENPRNPGGKGKLNTSTQATAYIMSPEKKTNKKKVKKVYDTLLLERKSGKV
jgi:hypothetical protein